MKAIKEIALDFYLQLIFWFKPTQLLSQLQNYNRLHTSEPTPPSLSLPQQLVLLQ